ncbi:MAG: phosphate signaling complex protein PhoU [Phycisphaeraceae bacterium]|nr:MAG: phosphate signaling complex protein PhoU [Phycisphaeraceae bacterium]
MGAGTSHATPFHRELSQLRRRLIRSANVAIDMLEAALYALWHLDHDIAREIRARDDFVDDEEVRIEQVCLRLLTLQQPYGQDFRLLAFCLKVNADIERVADHATSVAKVALRVPPGEPPRWPVSLVEMGDRVPVLAHELLRAVLDENVDAARLLVRGDSVIDTLDKQLFREVTEWINADPSMAEIGLLTYRLGRELERVGDLLGNIAEDVVYLATGEIIRHQGKPRHRGGPGGT